MLSRARLLPFALSFGAIAAPAGSPSAVHFTPVDRVAPELRPENFAAALPASIRLRAKDENCSGTVVSDNGHVLTALHCIARCLIDQGAAVPAPQKNAPQAWSIDPAKLSVDCTLGGDLVGTVRHIGARGFLGENQIATLETSAPKLLKQLFSGGFDGVGGAGDFAILEVPALRDGACIPMAENNRTAGDFVWSISYPEFERKDGTRGNGEAQFTSGFVTKGFADIAGNTRATTKLFTSVYGHSGLQLSTLDIAQSASGSGVLDESFQVVGVQYMNFSGGREAKLFEYRAGAAGMIGIRNILGSIRDPELLKAALQCSARTTPLERTPASLQEMGRELLLKLRRGFAPFLRR